MIAFSLAIHTLFLYGIRIESERADEPPRVMLNATIAAQQRETIAEPQIAVAEPKPVRPVEKSAPVIKPEVKKITAKPPPKKASAPEPVLQRVTAIPVPEAAPDMAPSPDTEIAPASVPITDTPPSEPAPPPSFANIRERSGAKIRAPAAIENPTMPADDAPVAASPVAAAELSTTPLPAIATAPHPIEPIAQDGPPPSAAIPKVENTPYREPASPAPAQASETPPVAQQMPPPPTQIAKVNPSVLEQPAPRPTAMLDPNALPLPAVGEAQYKLRMGLVSGELIVSWNFADGHYSLNSVAQGTGIFAIAGKYVQASEGDITSGGLRPIAFSVERRGRKDSAKFNWPESSVQFNGKSGERTEAVIAGTQDMLSLLFQLAFTPPLGEDLTVIVTNGRKLQRYAFERAGEESIALEGGTFRTLKILKRRSGDEDGMEVWLALEHHYLPVKIRVTDKKGSVVEQTLMAMKVLGATP